MKIVIAMDSFKGSLTAVRACDVVAETIRSAVPDAVVVTKPMADGGEGTATTLMAAAGGRWIEAEVMGPLPGMRVAGGFAWLPQTRTAVVEMAVASGLPLLRPDQYNPLETTTFGTGQLIQAAIEHGAEQVLLAIGGSATVDGGVGAAMALGWRFPKRTGERLNWVAVGCPRSTRSSRRFSPSKRDWRSKAADAFGLPPTASCLSKFSATWTTRSAASTVRPAFTARRRARPRRWSRRRRSNSNGTGSR